ncbi:MAG: hypothetical protein AMS21_03870 [Gemmatimonas sp. SG8_38_2]|nr:MAG: hypothetical protein AMS21_03870 [Gemmatimonas sp. SG8_38_2]
MDSVFKHDLQSATAVDLKLDVHRIIETIQALRIRIEERFPDSGLGRVAERLESIATHTGERLQRVTRPNVPLRATVVIVTLTVVALPMIILVLTDLPVTVPDIWELVQAVDAAVQDVIFVGLLLFFLYTLENRIKRRRALHFLRELRALAHIIDMYQLTKDPDRFLGGRSDTPSSPTREMGKYRLGRYLDYCSEMLSLVSKLAALYAQSIDDPVVLAAVDEVEGLTSGLSSKIWQKIITIGRSTGAPSA